MRDFTEFLSHIFILKARGNYLHFLYTNGLYSPLWRAPWIRLCSTFTYHASDWIHCAIKVPLITCTHHPTSEVPIGPLAMTSLVHGCIWPIIMQGDKHQGTLNNIPAYTPLARSEGCGPSELKVVSFITHFGKESAEWCLCLREPLGTSELFCEIHLICLQLAWPCKRGVYYHQSRTTRVTTRLLNTIRIQQELLRYGAIIIPATSHRKCTNLQLRAILNSFRPFPCKGHCPSSKVTLLYLCSYRLLKLWVTLEPTFNSPCILLHKKSTFSWQIYASQKYH